MHPADHIRGQKDDVLEGKTIVLGVTGSIAAVETVKLARELTRLGARVIPVMTHAAARIIHPDALWFACGTPAITELTGAVEHVALCGDVPDHADLLLIAPCTANTIGKIAYGVDDTPVTTMATTALGTGIPVVLVPAMHGSMYENPMVAENLDKLSAAGIIFTGPKIEEGKAKMASQDDIVLESLRALGPRKLEYTRVLVIAGPTREPVDSMRTLTNRSTGRTGRELAREAYRMGADVMLWLGGDARAPNIPSERFGTAESLKKLVEYDGGGWDIILVPAAIADYSPVREDGKIPSGHGSLSLELRRVDKLLPLLRKKTRFLVGFKAETHVGRDELILRARKRMEEAGADMMIANCLEDVSLEETSVLLVRKDSVIPYEGRKGKVARAIMAEVGALAKG